MTDDSNVQQLPGRISIDLDTATRPEKDIKPPFVANVNGREITMIDPAEVDWRDLALMESPGEFLRFALSPEDRKYLLEQELPGWKFERLMEAYYNHFELEKQVAAAKRQQAFGG